MHRRFLEKGMQRITEFSLSELVFNLPLTSLTTLMIRRWRKTIIAILFIVGVMLLFPPFHVIHAPGNITAMGYGFLLNPPKFQDRVVSTVDMHALILQIGSVLFLGILYGILFQKE